MIFWDTDADEHTRRREREAGLAATLKQRRKDGYATFRIQAMVERPFCQICGKHFAWCVYLDKRYCMTCAPCEVEPIRPPDFVDLRIKLVYRKCGYCGARFGFPVDAPEVYCTPQCESKQREKWDRQSAKREAERMAGRDATDAQIIEHYVTDRMTVREIGNHCSLSSYQVSEVLKRNGIARRSRSENAKMQRDRNAG